MNWLKNKSVLVPFDYSDASIHGVRTALGMVESEDQVRIVYVWPQLPEMEAQDALDEEIRKRRIRESTSAITEALAKADIGGVRIDVLIGDPANKIVEHAEEMGTDVIVIPSHGYSGVKRWFLGSVCERVVRHAKCPVLVLKKAGGE